MSLSTPRLKWKKCAECGDKFMQMRPKQPVCDNLACKELFALKVIAKGERKREKVEKANDRQKRDQLKTRSKWIKEAQIAFNAYIRARDRGLDCICCARPLVSGSETGGDYDCGHYRSVGSAPHLRFDERNAHGQRKQCNRYGCGRAVDYRIGLIRRIGAASVMDLEADQTPKHYTIDDLKAIKAEYVEKRKQLIKAREDQL